MMRLARMVKKIWAWLTCRPAQYCTTEVEELPDQLQSKILYVAGENEHLWFAAMTCPCGCGETLSLGLMRNQRPCWTVTRHGDGTASLHPSVSRKVGCKSHFWLKRGKIIWSK